MFCLFMRCIIPCLFFGGSCTRVMFTFFQHMLDNTENIIRKNTFLPSRNTRFVSFHLPVIMCHGMPGSPFLSLPLCQKEAVHFHLNGRSTCQGVEVKTHRTQRKNIVENDGGRPLFMFQWTTCSLHRPNPGAILQLIHHHPPHQRHSAPFPLCTNPFIFLGKYMCLLRSPAHFHSLQRTVFILVRGSSF